MTSFSGFRTLMNHIADYPTSPHTHNTVGITCQHKDYEVPYRAIPFAKVCVNNNNKASEV